MNIIYRKVSIHRAHIVERTSAEINRGPEGKKVPVIIIYRNTSTFSDCHTSTNGQYQCLPQKTATSSPIMQTKTPSRGYYTY